MNYRHAYHAGNFADVFKHAALTLVLAYLGQKPAGFRMIDTHAGDGLYDLSGTAAEKTAEWRNGIGRLIGAEIPAELRRLLDPYLAVVVPHFAAESPRYPGSPLLAAALLRKQDRMIFCEAHPEAVGALRANLGHDKRAKIIAIDGFVGLGAFVPPIERRGLVLVDPPFEAKNEFARIAAAIETALRKWPTGTYMIWFPIKDRPVVTRFYGHMGEVIAKAGVKDALRVELWINDIGPDRPLAANGLLVINPPYVLEAQVKQILPYLGLILGAENRGGHAVTRF